MSNTSHTPGPWSYENEGQTVYVGEGQWIAQVRGWGWLQKMKNGEAVQDANGRLIAAAPELLEALELLVDNPYREGTESDERLRRIARAAIAKAKWG